VRLQKLLAAAGIASRRSAEELIAAGAVKVNGKVITTLGVQVHERHDRVEVNGRACTSRIRSIEFCSNRVAAWEP